MLTWSVWHLGWDILTYGLTDSVTKCSSFKTCSMQLKNSLFIWNVANQWSLVSHETEESRGKFWVTSCRETGQQQCLIVAQVWANVWRIYSTSSLSEIEIENPQNQPSLTIILSLTVPTMKNQHQLRPWTADSLNCQNLPLHFHLNLVWDRMYVARQELILRRRYPSVFHLVQRN